MHGVAYPSFEGHRLAALQVNSRPALIAHEVGTAIGYSNGSRFADKIRGEWSDDFVAGTDFDLLEGDDLAPLKELPTETVGSHDSVVGARAKALLVLYEPGLHMALLKTRKPAGRRLRRWLVDEVLPGLARAGAYGSPLRATLAALPNDAVGDAARPALELLAAEEELGRTLPGLRAALFAPRPRGKRAAKPTPNARPGVLGKPMTDLAIDEARRAHNLVLEWGRANPDNLYPEAERRAYGRWVDGDLAVYRKWLEESLLPSLGFRRPRSIYRAWKALGLIKYNAETTDNARNTHRVYLGIKSTGTTFNPRCVILLAEAA